jgi:hypothetical protein
LRDGAREGAFFVRNIFAKGGYYVAAFPATQRIRPCATLSMDVNFAAALPNAPRFRASARGEKTGGFSLRLAAIFMSQKSGKKNCLHPGRYVPAYACR